MFNNMKKTYIKPACEVVEIKIESNLLQDSFPNNAGLRGGGSDAGKPDEPVRARQVIEPDWDEWE